MQYLENMLCRVDLQHGATSFDNDLPFKMIIITFGKTDLGQDHLSGLWCIGRLNNVNIQHGCENQFWMVYTSRTLDFARLKGKTITKKNINNYILSCPASKKGASSVFILDIVREAQSFVLS